MDAIKQAICTLVQIQEYKETINVLVSELNRLTHMPPKHIMKTDPDTIEDLICNIEDLEIMLKGAYDNFMTIDNEGCEGHPIWENDPMADYCYYI